MVQEKSGKFQGSGVWKFPTGVVDEVCPFGKFTHYMSKSISPSELGHKMF